MATELSQDLVIPAYTDTELTVKKVERGVTGIDYGEITLSSSASNITVEHNLKVTPKYVALLPYGTISVSYDFGHFAKLNGRPSMLTGFTGSWNEVRLEGGNESPVVQGDNFDKVTYISATNTVVKFNASYETYGSGTYYWFAIA